MLNVKFGIYKNKLKSEYYFVKKYLIVFKKRGFNITGGKIVTKISEKTKMPWLKTDEKKYKEVLI